MTWLTLGMYLCSILFAYISCRVEFDLDFCCLLRDDTSETSSADGSLFNDSLHLPEMDSQEVQPSP